MKPSVKDSTTQTDEVVRKKKVNRRKLKKHRDSHPKPEQIVSTDDETSSESDGDVIYKRPSCDSCGVVLRAEQVESRRVLTDMDQCHPFITDSSSSTTSDGSTSSEDDDGSSKDSKRHALPICDSCELVPQNYGCQMHESRRERSSRKGRKGKSKKKRKNKDMYV
ncbi:hypothetical protein NPIL_351481 [Nephila pilipes]|uniref:Uncharacterized protein n=1 Tax=Nephila pilipes TaxID=299642 RepID=A0A8X6PHG1_NEPPI|nr:hypothetical protein NPIL_351481 [Nephila pilipes]